MKAKRSSVEQIVAKLRRGGATAGAGTDDRPGLQAARDLRPDVPSLADPLRVAEGGRSAAAEGARAGERAPEEDRRRAGARHLAAEGRAAGKMVSPARRRARPHQRLGEVCTTIARSRSGLACSNCLRNQLESSIVGIDLRAPPRLSLIGHREDDGGQLHRALGGPPSPSRSLHRGAASWATELTSPRSNTTKRGRYSGYASPERLRLKRMRASFMSRTEPPTPRPPTEQEPDSRLPETQSRETCGVEAHAHGTAPSLTCVQSSVNRI
jgi:hypothetical protein